MSRRVLITGGCGFVGRRFTKDALVRGDDVVVVDDLSTGLHPTQWPQHLQPTGAESRRLRFVEQDVRRYVRDSAESFDLVLHLAAVVGGRLKIDGDPLAVATDLAIDADFFNWVGRLRQQPERVAYFSSSAVYPIGAQRRGTTGLLSEDLVQLDSDAFGMPDMTYGWSKLTGELLSRHAAELYGVHVAVFRPFSGYGEDQDVSYPFTSIIGRVVRKETPLVVWGSGDQERDFIHIDDVVEAVHALLPTMTPGEAVNLGTGEATSFRQLAELACAEGDHDAPVIADTSKPEGVFRRVGDAGRMRQAYVPRVSLQEGVRRALAYQRNASEPVDARVG